MFRAQCAVAVCTARFDLLGYLFRHGPVFLKQFQHLLCKTGCIHQVQYRRFSEIGGSDIIGNLFQKCGSVLLKPGQQLCRPIRQRFVIGFVHRTLQRRHNLDRNCVMLKNISPVTDPAVLMAKDVAFTGAVPRQARRDQLRGVQTSDIFLKTGC